MIPDGSLKEGDVFTAPYPFVRDTFEFLEEDGPVICKTWKPGVRFEACGPEDNEAVADAVGRIILTVVATFKPGRYPTRVFFTRQWESPNGRVFGKPKLRVSILTAFRRSAAGYRYPYQLAQDPIPAPEGRATGAEET